MKFTEQQKQAILEIADFLEERNSMDTICYDRASYTFAYCYNDSKYYNDMHHNDTINGFRDFYERSEKNQNTFCRNSYNFRDILKDAEYICDKEGFDEVWDDFITHLSEHGDFDEARDYALMRSVVCYEKQDLYTLGELAYLLESFIEDYDEYEHQDIERILKDICDNFSWVMKYEEAFEEIKRMLEESED